MAENPEEQVASTQQSLQSTHDPGWNDPPKWAFTPTPNTTGTPTKRLLNKRVAFPLSTGPLQSSAAGASQQLPASNLPPPPVQVTNLTTAPHAPLLAPSAAPKDADIPQIVDKQEALNKALENLQTVINNELDASKVEEVRKRLEVMKNMWNEDKLNEKIHGKVFKISEALKNKDIDAADKLHVSLMMDHAALCNTWISGIRHLILELREKQSESNASVQNSAQPIFMLNPSEVK